MVEILFPKAKGRLYWAGMNIVGHDRRWHLNELGEQLTAHFMRWA